MLWRDVATLIQTRKVPDGQGYYETEEIGRREVFVDVQSARRSEFYTARKADADIALVFLVRGADYEGEKRIEYTHPGDEEVTAYTVVRAYTKSGEVYELNCSLETAPASIKRKGAT